LDWFAGISTPWFTVCPIRFPLGCPGKNLGFYSSKSIKIPMVSGETFPQNQPGLSLELSQLKGAAVGWSS